MLERAVIVTVSGGLIIIVIIYYRDDNKYYKEALETVVIVPTLYTLYVSRPSRSDTKYLWKTGLKLQILDRKIPRKN